MARRIGQFPVQEAALVLKKCKKPDDVLCINAAEHFVKGKRQNQLTDEHIVKIIDTYRAVPVFPL